MDSNNNRLDAQHNPDATDRRPTIKTWLPCVGIGIAAFVFNTTEFVPVALLTDIAKGLGVTEAKAGLLITIYAWVVALASLPLILVFAKMERRKLMTSILILFIVGHFLSWQSSSYAMLLVSRITIAGSHAIFWSIAAIIAVQVSPPGYRSAGLSILATGSSLATVFGLPIGRTIGIYMGWRVTFLFIAIAACLVLVFLLYVLPVLTNKNSGSLKSLPSLARNRTLIAVYVLTVLMTTAHFTGYSYIEPFLINIAGLNHDVATIGLLIFGVAGIIGSLIFTKTNSKRTLTMMTISLIGVTIALLLAYPLALNLFSILSLCVFWGIAIMIFNLVFQYCIIKIAPQAAAVAMAIYSGIYNVGIGSGALIGAKVSTLAGTQYVGIAGCIIGTMAIVLFFALRKPYLKGNI